MLNQRYYTLDVYSVKALERLNPHDITTLGNFVIVPIPESKNHGSKDKEHHS